MKWTCSPNYINSPFDKLCLSRVTIVTKLSVTDYRGGACLWERLQQLGGQPDPDHRVHHRLPHPQPRVPRHHHLWPGDPHGHHDPDNVDTMLREWPLTPWTRFSKRDSRTGCGPRAWILTVISSLTFKVLTFQSLQQWHQMRSRHGRKIMRRIRSPDWKFLLRISPQWWQPLTPGQRWGLRPSALQVCKIFSLFIINFLLKYTFFQLPAPFLNYAVVVPGAG